MHIFCGRGILALFVLSLEFQTVLNGEFLCEYDDDEYDDIDNNNNNNGADNNNNNETFC